jgi:hypothetical protein
MNRDFTGLLFARASAIEGVGRLIDFTGALNQYNTSDSGDEADRVALAADWYAIGDDLRQAMIAHAKDLLGEVKRVGNP